MLIIAEQLIDLMSFACNINCHCRSCLPCTKACCENPAVRSGKCCDPNTLGRCLQPFSPQCFAPCCHQSVKLRENFNWVDSRIESVNRIKLINPLKELYGLGDGIAIDCEERFGMDGLSSYPCISSYLDAKLGKKRSKSSSPSNVGTSGQGSKASVFKKRYKDSSLPKGSRIVHSKVSSHARLLVTFESKDGLTFGSRSDLIAHSTNDINSHLPRKVAIKRKNLLNSSVMRSKGRHLSAPIKRLMPIPCLPHYRRQVIAATAMIKDVGSKLPPKIDVAFSVNAFKEF